jgi:hypothetical protein
MNTNWGARLALVLGVIRDGCDPAPAGPLTQFSAGTFEVGTDIKAGKYKTTGPDKSGSWPSCYWARNKDSSGSFESIIANDNIEGPGTVTVNAGEVFQASGSCVWQLAP